MKARSSKLALVIVVSLIGGAILVAKKTAICCSTISAETAIARDDGPIDAVQAVAPDSVPKNHVVRDADFNSYTHPDPPNAEESGEDSSHQFHSLASVSDARSREALATRTESTRTRRVTDFPPNALAMLKRDCPGSMVADCDRLNNLAQGVVEVRDVAEDGWPVWMEREILQSLITAPPPGDRSNVGVKCSPEACVFFVSADSVNHIFGTGLGNGADAFKRWLSVSPWADELAINNRKTGMPSVLAWEIVGWDDNPFIVWYVVRRKA